MDDRETNGSPELLRSRRQRGDREQKKRRSRLKSVTIAILLLFVLAGTSAVYLWMQVDRMFEQISSDSGDVELATADLASQRPLVMLLMGLDSREATRTLNTDVIMAIAVNPHTKQATVLSVPRDLRMQPKGYKAQKANAFYSLAERHGKDKPGGPEALVKKWFGELLNVQIDYVTVVNFRALEQSVDALGGIDIDVDMDMCYIDKADGTDIHLQKGMQTLNGKQALDFVRYRHSSASCGKERTAESGDLARNERQQRVLATIVDKATSARGLLSLNGLFAAAGANVQTDMPKRQLKSFLFTYALMHKSDIEYITLAGEWKSPYMVVKDSLFEAARQSLRDRIAAR